MSKVWNIGNTTVRNPKRIEMGLRVMNEQNLFGCMEGAENEEALTKALVDSGVVDSKSEGKSAAWLGRKWRSVMVKLGFLTSNKYRIQGKTFKVEDLEGYTSFSKSPYVLTPAGQRMVSSTTQGEVSDVFLKQMIKHAVPNPSETARDFDSHIKPFILFLSVLRSIQNEGKGLNQKEIAIFIQKIQPHKEGLSEVIVKEILDYREKRDALDSKRTKREFDQSLLEKNAEEMSIKSTTPLDYADTTIRYFSMTGLFEMIGSRVNIKEEKKDLVDDILESTSIENILTGVDYLNAFYGNIPVVKNEEVSARKEYSSLLRKAKAFDLKLPTIEVDPTLEELKTVTFNLEEQILLAVEDKFALEQQTDIEIEKIKYHISKIANKDRDYFRSIVDMPANLEWVVWRGFLSIDHITCPIQETRGFPVDADLKPRYPAPGGRADMLFEFEDHYLVVEVTLTTSTRQYIAECEPVRRHVAEERGGKPVYGLFIAPSLDNNFLHGLREYYKGDDLVQLKILPLTLNDFETIIDLHKTSKLNPSDIKELVLKGSDEKITNAIEWRQHIQDTLAGWVSERTKEVV